MVKLARSVVLMIDGVVLSFSWRNGAGWDDQPFPILNGPSANEWGKIIS